VSGEDVGVAIEWLDNNQFLPHCLDVAANPAEGCIARHFWVPFDGPAAAVDRC